jgi:hypothetical protein
MKFYDDDGTEITPDLVSKPGLCLSCANEDDPKEEPLRLLNRLDQQDEDEFQCGAYEPLT